MKTIKLIIAIFLMASSVSAATLKEKMLSDLEFIKKCFEVKYAPMAWKSEQSGWDLESDFQKTRREILELDSPTIKEFQLIMKRFFSRVKDYHVGISFYSMERATLPFTIKGIQGRYYIVYVDSEQVPRRAIEVGDELISFGGKSVLQAISEIIDAELGGNASETDQALAELILTHRSGELGHEIPQGEVVIEIKKYGSDVQKKFALQWDYTPEKIRDVSKLGMSVSMQFPKSLYPGHLLKENPFFKKAMVLSSWQKPMLGEGEQNLYAIGTRKSYLPRLGKVIWKGEENSPFDAYIFKMPANSPMAGKLVGYVRIAHYDGDDYDVSKFAEVITVMERRTEALVIDQINNPGGSLFYVYSLASMLTDVPLQAPKHHITLTQDEVYTAAKILSRIEEIDDDISAIEELGDEIGGYPIDYTFVVWLREYCDFIIGEWEAGHLYTTPIHIYGVDEINPHAFTRYTKPILLLTNSLDFSGGDFLPAILQDNNRATIFGTRTAGAGGFLLKTEFPNQTGIKEFTMTGSLAERVNNQPIENLGVLPDIVYKCSENDLQNDYEDYVRELLKGVELIVKGAA